MIKNTLEIWLPLTLAFAVLQGCEASDNAAFSGENDNPTDISIEGIPMMADSFVINTFQLDADGEPISLDSVLLVME